MGEFIFLLAKYAHVCSSMLIGRNYIYGLVSRLIRRVVAMGFLLYAT